MWCCICPDFVRFCCIAFSLVQLPHASESIAMTGTQNVSTVQWECHPHQWMLKFILTGDQYSGVTCIKSNPSCVTSLTSFTKVCCTSRLHGDILASHRQLVSLLLVLRLLISIFKPLSTMLPCMSRKEFDQLQITYSKVV